MRCAFSTNRAYVITETRAWCELYVWIVSSVSREDVPL
jgi:hypothetical protein